MLGKLSIAPFKKLCDFRSKLTQVMRIIKTITKKKKINDNKRVLNNKWSIMTVTNLRE